MKILEHEIIRELDASREVVFWNYWDHEHLYVVHRNYTSANVVYDNNRVALFLLDYKLPVFNF